MKSEGKISNFFKKNILYILIALCIIAVGLSLTLAFVSDKGKVIDVTKKVEEETDTPGEQTDENPSEQGDPSIKEDDETPKTVVFIMPVNNYTDISEYSDTMVFNSTMNRYSSHKAVDFYTGEGENVLCVYDGVVESVDYSLLTGYTVTVDHKNGLKTVYNSLLDGDSVTVNQEVKQGDIIGEVSTSNRQEYKDGSHLHFAVIENGNYISPAKYLVFNEK